jgi:predicted acylesterase/phospholipase RssA
VRGAALQATETPPAEPRVVVALGCGGLRGFCHLGALWALHDAGLPIHGLCGASSGALFGALYALDPSFEAAESALSVTPLDLLAFYGDRLRLAPTNPVGRRLAAAFEGRSLESLPVPLSVLALDLETGDEVVLRDGSLIAAIEASIAIPVFARPVAHQGRYLIDGGYGNVGPGVAAGSMGADLVVHVDLRLPKPAPPPLRWAAGRWLPSLRAKSGDSTPARRIAMAAATFALGGTDAKINENAIVTIAPTVSAGGAGTHLSAKAAFRLGEQSMRQAVPEIRARLGELLGASSN